MAEVSKRGGDGDADELRRLLAEPRGQLALFGATFAVAILIAVVAATQRPFFERYIQEKYPTPSLQAVKLADELGSRANGARGEIPESEWDNLYHLYMTSPDDGLRHLPPALLGADPARARSRLLRSWHAGSDAQRHRVLTFVVDAADPSLLVAVQTASRRSRPASTDLSRAMEELRDSLAPPGEN